MYIKSKSTTKRSTDGSILVELLISMMLASILALALCESIAQYMRLTTTIEGKEVAAIMAQEVLERVRNIPFDDSGAGIAIDSNTIYDLTINDTDPKVGTQPCAALARPLLRDTSKFRYSDLVDNTSANDLYHKFKGRVTLSMGPGPLDPISKSVVPGTKTATVHVYWWEPNVSKMRDFEVKSVLYRYGIQHHGGFKSE